MSASAGIFDSADFAFSACGQFGYVNSRYRYMYTADLGLCVRE